MGINKYENIKEKLNAPAVIGRLLLIERSSLLYVTLAPSIPQSAPRVLRPLGPRDADRSPLIGRRPSRDRASCTLIGGLLLRCVRLSSATASLLAFARGTPRKAGDKQKRGPFFLSFFLLSFFFFPFITFSSLQFLSLPVSPLRLPLAPLRPGTAPDPPRFPPNGFFSLEITRKSEKRYI